LAMTTRVVLAGAGHAHAQVLQAWARQPVDGIDLVVVSPHAWAPYSGMVPGWLAGLYRYENIVIDFAALCARAGARWVTGSITRLDPDSRCIQLDNGDSLTWDWLSLNTGSTLVPPVVSAPTTMLSMRPLDRLRTDYDALLEGWRLDPPSRPYRVTAVGGGAAGFESVLAVCRRLRALRPTRRVNAALVTRGDALLPGYPDGARRHALRALANAGVDVRLQTAWSDDSGCESDLVLWATGAQAHAWQRTAQERGALATSADGFVLVDRHLRSLSHPHVFAVGDCAQWATPLPKAGVYAVRMGPVLTRNLRAALLNQPLSIYQPQARYLSLLSTADGSAIASRGRWSLAGRWAWRWKDHIDRQFVRQFTLPFQPPVPSSGTSS
jgi:pyridine nucleotide-disulfide oxidoreductase family protein